MWGMLGHRVKFLLPRWLDVSHSISAATQRAPQVERPMLVRRKGTRSTLSSSPPHMQLLFLEGKIYEHTAGRDKVFAPLGTWLPDAMSSDALLKQRTWTKQLPPSSGDTDFSPFWYKEGKGMNPTPVAFPPASLFLCFCWTWRRAASHDKPDRFWYGGLQKCVLRFSAHATTMTHFLWLQEDRDNLASPEQTSGITSMMHTFIGIIIFLD